MGLGNKIGVARFYMSDEKADSSLIEPRRYSSVVEIQTTTLDSFLQSRGITAVKLLKLEAEGLEPEVLEGAADSLSMIQYLALDGGNERGVSQEETFSRCANVLYGRGFQLVEVNFRLGRALFAKTNAR